jgi:hypothetical protein
MTLNLETRIARLEQWRLPRPPYVVRVNFPVTAEDRAAVANAAAVLPFSRTSARRLRNGQHDTRGGCSDDTKQHFQPR